ncbi:MAG: Cys-tRNA(Pro) deacylase [Cyanophyceae cyanobacterium]
MKKTNAVRLLDNLGIEYQLLTYSVDPDDLAAQSAAAKLDFPPEQLFKTLVARGSQVGVCFAVVPANVQLSFKALAKLAGDRKLETVPLKAVQSLTGYIRGGVTALAARKNYPVYIDETCQHFEKIAVSAGVRGMLIQLAPADYIRATQGMLGAIAIAVTSD